MDACRFRTAKKNYICKNSPTPMRNHSLISISDLTKEEILSLIERAKAFEANPNQHILDGRVVGSLFFEPSTRTRLSFETAVKRLGGRIIGFSDVKTSSQAKGESLKDTIMMVSNYADLIVMRHYLEGAARYASEVASVPVINAGDGANQHPTQTMLDLYTIAQTQGTLENLTITMVGDLKYGRTVHSLLEAMHFFHPKFRFISCEELRMPAQYKQACREWGIEYEETTEFSEDIINETDIKSSTQIEVMTGKRVRVRDTDKGEILQRQIKELRELLHAYQHGIIKEK